jgi:hypothetical protein
MILSNFKASAKSWRPHILTLFDTPAIQKNLAYFSHALNQGKGLLTFGVNLTSEEKEKEIYEDVKKNLQGFKIPSYLHLNVCQEPFIGKNQIIRNYGFGLLKPNSIFLAVSDQSETKPYIQLLLDIYAQHKNIVLLKDDPLKDYLFTDPTRKDKQINLWWRGKYPGNFELCLALAYLLQQSKLWPKAKIFIKMIAKDESQKEKLFTLFENFRSEWRVNNLEFAPFVDVEENFFSNFTAHSQNADLTFLGLKSPKENCSVEEYEEYYVNLLENTKHVHNIAYVLCGEKIAFRKIFRD